MKFLLILPAINAVGILIVIIAVCCSKRRPTGDISAVDTNLPDNKEFGQPGISSRDNPTIAQQYDTRITNIFKNPMEGIL